MDDTPDSPRRRARNPDSPRRRGRAEPTMPPPPPLQLFDSPDPVAPTEPPTEGPHSLAQRIVALHNSGYTAEQIAERAVCASATVRDVLRDNGIRPRELDDVILALYSEGHSVRRIASEAGCSGTKVRSVLRGNKLQTPKRARDGETRTSRLQVLCSPAERDVIQSRAMEAGMSEAEFMRALGMYGRLPAGSVRR